MSENGILDMTESGGCGCKIPSSILSKILKETAESDATVNSKIILGFESSDDCAVYDNGDKYLLFTTDFFSPIVNDPYKFGQLAASNAISDIFSSGGYPLIVTSIMAFDPDSIKYDKIKLMIQGAQSVLNKFNVSIVGGHTIKNSQLLYGFSVIGEVEKNRLKLNNTGNAGDLIVTTRPLGVGILSNAIKAEFIDEAKIGDDIWNIITGDNYFARTISEFEKVTSMTDVTGFGLVGHISELIGKGHLNAELEFGSIDFFENVLSLASNVTGSESGSFHNMKKYSDKVEYIRHLDLSEKIAIHDPQTNGGIVFTVSQQIWDENRADWISQNNNIKVIGKLVEGSGVILIK